MKLYATVTSERATKGQGGNERITVHLKGSDKDDIAVITVFPWRNRLGDGLEHICVNVRDDVSMSVEKYKKGEKQKGELCPKYNEEVLPDENGRCSLCGLHDV